MVLLHLFLTVIAIVFGLLAIFLLILSIGDNEFLVFFVAAAIICGLSTWGATTIWQTNTITTTEVVEMEIKELTSDTEVTKYGNNTHYNMLLKNNSTCYNLKVDLDVYLQHSVGDVVDVEITTQRSKLYGTKTHTASLKY